MALTVGQRAMTYAMIHPEAGKPGRPKKGKSPPRKEFSYARLSFARKVLREAPECVAGVLAGNISIDAALKSVQADRLARIKASPIHEAAHAIIGRVLGIECGDVRVGFDHATNSYGRNESGGWDSHGRKRPARYGRDADIICTASGEEAEIEFLGSSCEGAWADRAGIDKLLDGDPNAEKIERRLRRMARMLVRRHAIPIRYVAQVLTKAGTLTGAELDRWWASVRTKHLRSPVS